LVPKEIKIEVSNFCGMDKHHYFNAKIQSQRIRHMPRSGLLPLRQKPRWNQHGFPEKDVFDVIKKRID